MKLKHTLETRLAAVEAAMKAQTLSLEGKLDLLLAAVGNQTLKLEDLADRLEHEAAYEASRGDTWDATCIRAEARRIRRALNGDDQ